MRFLMNINALLFAYSIALGGLAATVPLCSDTIDIAGGGTPNSENSTAISMEAIKELQLAVFLENLQVSLFNTGLTNLTGWDMSGYTNDTLQTISIIAAVNSPLPFSVRCVSDIIDNSNCKSILLL